MPRGRIRRRRKERAREKRERRREKKSNSSPLQSPPQPRRTVNALNFVDGPFAIFTLPNMRKEFLIIALKEVETKIGSLAHELDTLKRTQLVHHRKLVPI